jgi:hypothetical protein
VAIDPRVRPQRAVADESTCDFDFRLLVDGEPHVDLDCCRLDPVVYGREVEAFWREVRDLSRFFTFRDADDRAGFRSSTR